MFWPLKVIFRLNIKHYIYIHTHTQYSAMKRTRSRLQRDILVLPSSLHAPLTILYNIKSFKVQCIYRFYRISYCILIISFY